MMLLPGVGQLVQGNANAAALKGQANSQEYAGKVADINAGMALQQGDRQEELSRRQSRQALGDQRAAIAQSGTGFGGSNADIMQQSATNAEMDALNIRYGAQVEATSYKNEGNAQRYNAKLSRAGAKSARTVGYLNATTAFMDSANKAFSGGFSP